MDATDPPQKSIVDKLDRLSVTALHIFVVAVSALGFVFDLAEITMGSALSAVFSAPPTAATPSELSLLLAAVYVGAVFGAPSFGWLADRIGRRLLLAWALFILVATSLAAAASPSIYWLTVFRGLSGLALGAYPPLMIAYLTDILPARSRGPLIMSGIALAYIGPPGILFLIRWLTPLQPLGLEAWRWAFALGGCGALFAGLLFLRLPESPRWLIAAARPREAEAMLERFERSPVLFRQESEKPAAINAVQSRPASDDSDPSSAQDPRQMLTRWLLVGALYFLLPWATVGFTQLNGAVLIAKGFKVAATLLYIAITTLAPILGTLVSGLLIDRIERRAALTICAGAMALAGLAFGIGTTPFWLIAAGTVFNLLASIYIAVLVLYAAELFPTAKRGVTTSSAWAVNRIASALVPLSLLPLLHSEGPIAMFTVIALSLIAGAVVLLALGPPGAAGRAVS
jgi:putative MFS transporter